MQMRIICIWVRQKFVTKRNRSLQATAMIMIAWLRQNYNTQIFVCI
jgi:hypothetical protein